MELENEKIDKTLLNIINHNYKFKHKNNTQIIVEYSTEKLLEDFMIALSNMNTKSIEPLDITENVKFLVCRNKSNNQYFTFKVNNYENITEEERSVFNSYSKLYDMLKSSYVTNPNNFFHYEKDECFTHTIHTNDNYILFVSFNLFSEFEDINSMTLELLKSIKLKESYYFIKKISV